MGNREATALSQVGNEPVRLPAPSWSPDRGLISRSRLTDEIERRGGSGLVLISAPAGYGKTTLLTEWESEDARPFGWVTVDSRDNDPAFFARTIGLVLDEIEPVTRSVFDVLSGGARGLVPSAIPRLAAAVAGREQPFVLVLDDFHLVTDPQALDLVRSLAAAVPEGSQIAVACRSDPGLQLGRLRAAGRLTEIGPSDLAMTRGEVAELLENAGVDLDAAALQEFTDRTEGWPVALYLALRSFADEPDPRSALRRFTGDDRVMADYLNEELIASIDDSDHGFLATCSVLDQLSGPACDALLDRQGSAEDLRRLSHSNLLVIPLDRADREFRYHPLFREMLLAELERGGEERLAELHLRASAHFDAGGDADRAIEHAIQSGDAAKAGALVWESAADYMSHGRNATVAGWLDRFTEDAITATPPLALTQGMIYITDGDGPGADRVVAAARATFDRVDAELGPALEVAADLIAACGGTKATVQDAREAGGLARSLLSEDDRWRALACFIEGAGLHLGGDEVAARSVLVEGARLGDRRVPTLRTLCLAQQAVLLLDAGEETEAWSLEEHSVATMKRYGLGELGTQAFPAAVSALVRARRGRIEEAMTASRRAAALLASMPGIAPWYGSETRVVLARALIHLDDTAGARAHLADADELVRGAGTAPALTEMFEQARDAASRAPDVERWPLTPAELRLLHLLPTHHSFREIAGQLYVSTNTVKSQARSIYRKLGVASRAEAVSAAQAGGLIAAERDPAARV